MMKKSVIQDKTNLSPAKQLLLEKRLRGESVVASKVRLPLRPMVRPVMCYCQRLQERKLSP